MCRALELWATDSADRIARLSAMRDQFEADLRAVFPDVVVNAVGAQRLPHTSNLAFPGLERQALLMALDLAGVACSTGAACASGSTDPSPTLAAMGCPDEVLRSSLRFSFGATTTTAEVREAVDRITRVVKDLRSRGESRKMASPSRESTANSLY
jgi:cysteine desulfurase